MTAQPFIARYKSVLRELRTTALCVVALMILGCNNGADRLNDLASKFSLVRAEMNEMRQLIHSLARTERITGFKAGILYNDTPATVIFNEGRPVHTQRPFRGTGSRARKNWSGFEHLHNVYPADWWKLMSLVECGE